MAIKTDQSFGPENVGLSALCVVLWLVFKAPALPRLQSSSADSSTAKCLSAADTDSKVVKTFAVISVVLLGWRRSTRSWSCSWWYFWGPDANGLCQRIKVCNSFFSFRIMPNLLLKPQGSQVCCSWLATLCVLARISSRLNRHVIYTQYGVKWARNRHVWMMPTH